MRDFQAPGRSAIYAANGLCATSHPHATRVAIEILRSGGNAVDAGVAAAFVLNMCEPAMTGLGGDCFALYAPPGKPLVALNGSGRAPKNTNVDAIRSIVGDTLPLDHPAAITIPGAVAGLCRLQADYGRIDRAEVLAPAIDAAESGVPVAPRAAYDWENAANTLQGAARRFFLRTDGSPLRAGDLFRAPRHAEILRHIVKDGARGFYKGDVATDMVDTLQAFGGAHTLEDFAEARTDYVEPISTQYRGHEVAVPPPNGQGVVTLLMLDMIGQFNIGDLPPLGADRAHLEAEIAKLAYDARDRFVSEPETIGSALKHLRAPNTAASLAALIDFEIALPPRAIAPKTTAIHSDTVYLAVIDRDGGALSLIYSIFKSFGSGLASERYGVLFHNRGASFTLEHGHPNRLGPGKRPMHTIIPGMLLRDGRAIMPFGVMGGHYQAAGQTRLLTNLLDYGFDPQAAIDAPRSFPEDGRLKLETSYPANIATQLASKGHDIARASGPIGGAQAIWIDPANGVLIGASDPRKDGCALGY